ncbi:MAG: hypothetical protein Q9160_003915 [Pyrenula sp. 1 TL-2023]
MATFLPSISSVWLIIFWSSYVHAATRVYDFELGWVRANPDGQFERPTIGINGQWPIPRIEATVGDRLVVNVNNQLGNQTASLHFHGIFQNGTTEMDGSAGVSHCPIPAGSRFTYNFTVDQPGTYWYHSHNQGQYPDGLRGPLIVNDPKSPYADQYDDELVLTLSDWYYDQMPGLISSFISVANPTGAEPVPDSALMNDTQNLQIPVQPGKTYMIRLVNMAAFAAQYFWIEDHSFTIVEVDGVYTEPAETDMIYLTAAQRYSILLTTKNDTSSNFAIVGSMDQDLFDTVPPTLNPNVTSYLVYSPSAPLPSPSPLPEFTPFDDFLLTPQDRTPLLPSPSTPTHSLTLNMKMDNLLDGANYAFFNSITYVPPLLPSLYTALTTGPLATNPTIYGTNTNPFILSPNQAVEIVLNNQDPGKHPFHLHGHNFQAVYRSDENAGDYDPNAANATAAFRPTPMRRDTFMVKPNGHIVLRFTSDNPGVWLFHCHIEWHVSSGLSATFIEAPLELQKQKSRPDNAIPRDHYDACAAAKPSPIPTKGNAAGKTDSADLMDLDGATTSPRPLPPGFTGGGIAALVVSCVVGLVGVAVVAWYGAGEWEGRREGVGGGVVVVVAGREEREEREGKMVGGRRLGR